MNFSESDRRHLRAAEGWLELGSAAEAIAEIDQLPADLREAPEVLRLKWQIHSRAGEWERCVQFAEALVQAAPDDPFGWIHRSYALHELKRTQEALDLLLPVADTFPEEHIIPYNLACYTCQLGQLEAAKKWLHRASEIGGAKSIRAMARKDPDLQPLHGELGS